MKRSLVVACVLALTLALGLSVSAGASVNAESSAKPAKKGKGCKGKGKAGKSAAASAKPKKGKKKPCKAKGKAKKGGDKTTPAPTTPGAVVFGDGSYSDAAAKLDLTISNGASTVVLKYVPPGDCVAINYTSQPVTLTKSGDTWTASETRDFSIVGTPAHVKWDLTIKDGLTYALNLAMDSEADIIGACKWEGHPTGTLVKTG